MKDHKYYQVYCTWIDENDEEHMEFYGLWQTMNEAKNEIKCLQNINNQLKKYSIEEIEYFNEKEILK